MMPSWKKRRRRKLTISTASRTGKTLKTATRKGKEGKKENNFSKLFFKLFFFSPFSLFHKRRGEVVSYIFPRPLTIIHVLPAISTKEGKAVQTWIIYIYFWQSNSDKYRRRFLVNTQLEKKPAKLFHFQSTTTTTTTKHLINYMCLRQQQQLQPRWKRGRTQKQRTNKTWASLARS